MDGWTWYPVCIVAFPSIYTLLRLILYTKLISYRSSILCRATLEVRVIRISMKLSKSLVLGLLATLQEPSVDTLWTWDWRAASHFPLRLASKYCCGCYGFPLPFALLVDWLIRHVRTCM